MVCCAMLLASCGGSGDNQRITQVKTTLKYSQQAVIYIAGIDLRYDMVVTTKACKNPTFSSQSIPELAILNCTLGEPGEYPLSIASPAGKVLYSGTLTVPQPQVTLVTPSGNIVMELNPAVAPITVNNFLAYVNKGAYARTLFHRVIPGFVVQGGGYASGLVKIAQSAPIVLESNKGLSNVSASVAMARTDVFDSATSEFYINLADNSKDLDYQDAEHPGYAVFGKVVQGMDVVDAIASVPTGTVGTFLNVPTTDIAVTIALQTQ